MGPAGVLFNGVLRDLDFKLTGLVLKASWHFFNETDLTFVKFDVKFHTLFLSELSSNVNEVIKTI